MMEFLSLKVKCDDHEGMNFRGVTVDIVNVRSPWIMFFVFFGCNIKLLSLDLLLSVVLQFFWRVDFRF